MAPGGFLDRMMRSSVERALRLQPPRSRRLVNETRFATSQLRPHLEDMRVAGRRLVAGDLAVPALTRLALRLPGGDVVATTPNADLAAVDAQDLDTCEPGPLADVAAELGATIVAHPSSLLALAAVGRLPDPTVSTSLGEAAGPIEFGPPTQPGIGLLRDGAVLAAASTVVECVVRLEAAERLALVTLRRPHQEEP